MQIYSNNPKTTLSIDENVHAETEPTIAIAIAICTRIKRYLAGSISMDYEGISRYS